MPTTTAKASCPKCRRCLHLEFDDRGQATVPEHDNYLQTARCELGGKRIAMVEPEPEPPAVSFVDPGLLYGSVATMLMGMAGRRRRFR